MQAVIMAAGRGTRMGPLTDTRPKPMLEIAGKPVLEYEIDNLPAEVDEVILIVGYLGSVIHDYFGGSFKGRRILYVEQDILNGTAGALWAAKDLLKGKFLVMNGDDIYARADMQACLPYEWAALGLRVDALESAGKIEIDAAGNVLNILEKESHTGGPGYANTNFFLLDTRIFSYAPVKRPQSEELGLPQTVVQAARDVPIHMVPATTLIRLTTPDDLKKAERLLAQVASAPHTAAL